MSLTIVGSLALTEARWQKAVEAAANATFFHSPQWARVWAEATGQRSRPEAREIQFSDGRSAVFMSSVSTGYGGLIRQHLSSVQGTYGGWISDAPLSDAHSRVFVQYLQRNFSNLVWRANPLDTAQVTAAMRCARVEYDETQVLALDGPLDDITQRWSKGHRAAVAQARRGGVAACPVETQDSWSAYWHLYELSRRRWGDEATSAHPRAVFDRLFDLSKIAAGVRLWLAYLDDIPVAGALCLAQGSHVSYWHGAADSSYFKLRPVNLLLHEAIAWYSREGYRWFDFNPSGGHAGVARFKKGFGTRTLPAPVVRFRSLPKRGIDYVWVSGQRIRALRSSDRR